MSQKTRTLADFVGTAIGPVLIMGMVGSLVFFLIEVAFGPNDTGPLNWTFFFYVGACVLVARIAIEHGDARAAIYSLALGGAALIGSAGLIEMPYALGWLVHVGLLALVWWCCRKLTIDCTHIDDKQDGSDHSLLEAAGIDALERPEEWREPEPEDDEPIEEPTGGIGGWFESYRKYRERQKSKPHTPGVWVVYFALAALPIFGLGQALIPAEEEGSRRYTFMLMAVYMGSALGLLMTTSFLGLRRYLQQRKVNMPTKLAGAWLGMGAGLILLFLVVAAILPRPSSETSVLDMAGISLRERDASDWSPHSDGKTKGDGDPGDKSSEDSKSKSSTEGKSKEAGKGKGSEESSKGSGQDKGKGGDSGKSKQSGGDKNGKGKENDSGKSKKDSDKSEDKNSKDSAGKDKNSSSGSKEKTSGSGTSRQSPGSRNRSPRSQTSIGSLGKIGEVFKWIVFGVIALVVLFFALRHGLKFLANFTTWARQLLDFFRNFWANLFGSKDVVRSESDEAADDEPAPYFKPFSDFRNPFESGEAAGQSPGELVRYSYSALEAFAREHGWARRPQETAMEFAGRVAQESERLNEDAPKLAILYARLAYARGRLPESCREHVGRFWQQLELAHDDALSDAPAARKS